MLLKQLVARLDTYITGSISEGVVKIESSTDLSTVSFY
jgi:hypothetical protein